MKILLYTLFLTALHHPATSAHRIAHQPDTVAVILKSTAADQIPSGNHMLSLIKVSNAKLMTNIMIMYSHLAFMSLKKGSAKQAEETLLKKAVPLSIRYGTDQTNYNCFMSLARCYMDQKKYSQAKWYFIQSNISAKKAGYPEGEVLSLIQLGHLKKILGDHSLARADFKEAERIAVLINYKTTLAEIRSGIASLPK